MSQKQNQKVYKNCSRKSTIIKQISMYLIGIPVMFLASCTSAKQDAQDTLKPVEINNTNVIKVLNRVTCQDKNQYCPQERINRIWQSCINDGYVTSLTTGEISSSRELKELTRNSYMISINTPNQISDENGIVYESENESVTTQKEIVFTGYCIGSEYITK